MGVKESGTTCLTGDQGMESCSNKISCLKSIKLLSLCVLMILYVFSNKYAFPLTEWKILKVYPKGAFFRLPLNIEHGHRLASQRAGRWRWVTSWLGPTPVQHDLSIQIFYSIYYMLLIILKWLSQFLYSRIWHKLL